MSASPFRPILIAGATASGKSALALALAERLGGVVINADSMQVYTELPILTAQPSHEDRVCTQHWLYGHVPAREAYSTGKYLADMQRVLAEAAAQNLRPIIVGGTGLYFKALLEGLSPVPAVPVEVRAKWRARAEAVSATELHGDLARRDIEMARRLNPADRQRVTRALEVIDATGVSLASWQQQAGTPVIDAVTAVKFVVARSRDELHARCDQRFDLMMADGALEEVRVLATQQLSTDLPAMRALGVAPLLAHLAGSLSRDAAIAQGKLETRQYVKRQQTWLKRNMMSWITLSAQQMENLTATVDAVVCAER